MEKWETVKDVEALVEKHSQSATKKTAARINLTVREMNAQLTPVESSYDLPAWWLQPQKWINAFGTIADLVPIALHIGAGPSLDQFFGEKQKDLSRVATNHRVSTFACDAACFPLAQFEKKPEYVVTAEETGHCKLFFESIDPDFFKGPMLLATSMIHSQTLAAWRGSEVRFWQNWTEKERERWLKVQPPPEIPKIDPIATNVLFHSIEIASMMGHGKHVLIGCDLHVQMNRPTHSEWTPNLYLPFAQHEKRFRFNIQEIQEAKDKKDPRLDVIYNCTEGGKLDLNNMTLREFADMEGMR